MKNGKEKKNSFKRILMVYAAVIATTIYIGWRIIFTIPIHYGIPSLIAGLALLISEIVAVFEAVEQYRNLREVVLPEKPIIPEEWYPEVDVFIATHNESGKLLFKTVNGCINMDYPDKSKVHIAICDDNNRPEIRELAEEMGVGYFGLTGNKLAKAGNLNNAISKTSATLIATFDADMIPTHSFLLETVPYFFLPLLKKEEGKWVKRAADEIDKDFKIGFIQTPQSFYNPDLFQYNLYSESRIPNEQDYFFREINIGRNRSNAPIYAGSNTVISRKALEEAGGIATGTITEDFETGLKIQSKGYSTYAIPTVVAHGLAPDTITGLINQRERWGRGCVQSLRKVKIFTNKDIPFKQKMSYIHCLLYWWTFLRRFIYILAPVLFILFNLHIIECAFWQVLFIWLPFYLLYNKVLTLISGNIRNHRWSNIIDTIIFPYMIIPIVLETVGISQKKFVVTRKDHIVSESERNLKLAVPHMILAGATFLSLISLLQDLVLHQAFSGIIVIYWLIVNLYNLIMAIFFMTGRTNYREAERFLVSLEAELEIMDRKYNCMTKDISEGGLAVLMHQPYYLPKDRDIKVTIGNRKYKSRFQARVRHVIQEKDQWKYSLYITEMDKENLKQYLQLIYDRDHSLPKYIGDTLSVFDDLYLNVQQRVDSSQQSQRNSPRVEIMKPMKTKEGNSVFVMDFNYEYILLKAMEDEENLSDGLILTPAANFEIRCSKIRGSHRYSKGTFLYKVENSMELWRNNEFHAVLSEYCEKSDDLGRSYEKQIELQKIDYNRSADYGNGLPVQMGGGRSSGSRERASRTLFP